MAQKVYITRHGIVSALGIGSQTALCQLRAGKTGIQKIKHLDTRYKGVLPAGEVDMTNQDLADALQVNLKQFNSRTTLLGLLAAREAWQHDAALPLRTGFISSTSVGGIDRSEIAFKRSRNHDDIRGYLRDLLSHDCGDSTERIADDLGIHGFVSTISTACSSSSNAMILGARMIQNDMIDKVLVGGTDALTVYTLNGFNTLKILDAEWCMPFDNNRRGLNLGEGAAFLTLESEKSMRLSGSTPICELVGFGNTNDAYHQTASSPDGSGAYHAMQMALQRGNLAVTDIDYINAHGTATPNNDLSEGTAIKNLFADYLPKFSSTKSFTGHTLAAAGAIEAVISVLLMKNKLLVPNLNFHDAMEEINLHPVTSMDADAPLKTVLSNSFGFGGNCSALVFAETS